VQCHFSRIALSQDLAADQRTVVEAASRLLLAVVDVISSNGCVPLRSLSRSLSLALTLGRWLHPALAAMELSQMVTQGLWARDPPLLQIPAIVPDTAARCAKEVRDRL
jgi:pre-mRNA-splicing helicase BRR2